MKKIIFLIMLILLCSFVTAYYPNQTYNIPASYSVNGIPTNVTALISIYLPDSTLSINNQTMESISTGFFNYTYTFRNDTIGQYYARVYFLNATNEIQGIATDIFDVQYNHNNTIYYINQTVYDMCEFNPNSIMCVLLRQINQTTQQSNLTSNEIKTIVTAINETLVSNMTYLIDKINNMNTSIDTKIELILANVSNIKNYLNATNQTDNQFLNNINNNLTYWFPKISDNQTYWFPIINQTTQETYLELLDVQDTVNNLPTSSGGSSRIIMTDGVAPDCKTINPSTTCQYWNGYDCIEGCSIGFVCDESSLKCKKDTQVSCSQNKELVLDRFCMPKPVINVYYTYQDFSDKVFKNNYLNPMLILPLLVLLFVTIILIIKNMSIFKASEDDNK